MKYFITSSGYSAPFPEFSTKADAMADLSASKREAVKACKRKLGTAKITSWRDGFKVEAGCNLWMSRNLVAVA